MAAAFSHAAADATAADIPSAVAVVAATTVTADVAAAVAVLRLLIQSTWH